MRNTLILLFLSILLIGCTTEVPQSSVLVPDMNPSETSVTTPASESPQNQASYPIKENDARSQAKPTREPTESSLPGMPVFTFDRAEPGWYTVDDNVMGGVSSSTVAVIDPSLLRFTGDMSLENNGGFSSVRSDWTPMNLSDADGVLLRVLGDGSAYRLRIRTASTGRGISYNALFETTPERWNLIYVPFSDMVPTYRGFVMDVGALDPANIGSFGFMLSDKQPGQFNLLVDWIRAVTEDEIAVLMRPAMTSSKS